jgi:ABC-type branched-subunit amino acid transport system substrate-binding protein
LKINSSIQGIYNLMLFGIYLLIWGLGESVNGAFRKWIGLGLVLLLLSCQGGLGWFSRETREPGPAHIEQEEMSVAAHELLCPEMVRRAIVEEDYGTALVLLEVEAELWGICGARALIGLQRYEEALSMLVETVRNSQVEVTLRTTACGLSLIAAVGLRDEGGADHFLMDCPSQVPVDTQHFLLLEDKGLLGVAVVETHATSGRYLSAVVSAADLLNRDLLDPQTHQWVTYNLFEWSRSLTPTERVSLEQSENPLLAVVYAYASMMAYDGENNPELFAQAGTLMTELETLGALPQALNVDYISQNREAVRPPLIGVLLPLSGGYSPIGRAVLEGMFLSQGVFGEPEAGESRLLIADMGETVQSALDGLEELEERNVLAVITIAHPNQMSSIVEGAAQLSLPLLVISLDGDRQILSERAYCLAPDPFQEGRLLAQYTAAHGHISVGIVEREPSSPYLRSLVTGFLSEAESHGMEITGPYPFLAVGQLRQESASQLAETLSGEHLDALLLADSFGRAMTLSSYLAQAQIWSDGLLRFPAQNQQTVLFLGNSTWHDPRLLQSEPNYLLGSVIPEGIFTEPPSTYQERFRTDFNRVFHRQPLLWHAYGFDALSILEEIIDRNGVRTRAGIHQGLIGLSPIPGVTGEIWFDDQLNRNQPVRLLMVTEAGFESQ